MSITTIAPHPLGDDTPIDPHAHAAGLADAYDEHTAGTPLAVLAGRLQHMTAHLDRVDDAYTAYVFGYADAVLTIRRHQIATTAAQTQLAYEDRQENR